MAIDRRQRRRQETIEEALDLAVEIMEEQGVGGLSLGEVARRMGIRPPSLYVYFPSKNAMYDALFTRGARSILAEVRRVEGDANGHSTLQDALLTAGRAFAGWCLSHQAYAQLLFWRPVPGFEPSDEAYAPAVELVGLTRGWFCELQQRGLIRADASIDTVLRDWTIVTSGVISQQLANGPDETLDHGRFTAALPNLVAMFVREYGTASPSRKKARNADKR